MTDQHECTCPLIDISRFAMKPEFILGDPRGSGCPIHETQAMRDERQRAEDEARYGIQLEFPGKISEQGAEECKRRFLAAYERERPYITVLKSEPLKRAWFEYRWPPLVLALTALIASITAIISALGE